jgi:HAD superfamily hydrolase (TIGR01509 family)
MASNIKAVFFDLGDTLVRISFVTLTKICKRISDIGGISLSTDKYTKAFHDEWKNRSSSSETKSVKGIETDVAEESERRYWRDFFENLLRSLTIQSDEPELIEWLINVYTDPKSFVCFDDVHQVLTKLEEKGLTLGIISNAFPSAEKILDYLKLRQYFKYIFLSFELPYAKPETKVYQFAAEKTNMPIENILFVDDRWPFVKGAQEANMNAWLIDRFPDEQARFSTKSLVNRIKNLKEIIEVIEFSQNEEIDMPRGQKSPSIARQGKLWNLCELPNK